MLKDLEKTCENYPVLANEELEKLHAEGRIEEIVVHNVALAFYLAKGQWTKFGTTSFEDCLTAALEGLTDAANRWDPNLGKFSTYAGVWMKTYMKDAYNQSLTQFNRHPAFVHKESKCKEFAAQFALENGRDPTPEEISEATGFPVVTVMNVFVKGIRSTMSLDNWTVGDEGEDTNPMYSLTYEAQLQEFEDQESLKTIERAMQWLTDEEREYVRRMTEEDKEARIKVAQEVFDLDSYHKAKVKIDELREKMEILLR